MKGNPSSNFESMEHNNERMAMVSHQSEATPKSVADNWQSGVFDMKSEAMDEAFGLAGKRGVESELRKAKEQFRDYSSI